MTQIPISIEIIETNKELERLIFKEFAIELNKRIPRKMKSIDKRVRDATDKFIKATPTYESLIRGELAGHFGLPVRGRRQQVNTIVEAVSNRMEIEFVPIVLRGRTYSNGFTFRVLLRSLSEVLNLPEASLITEKGRVLDWLHWLLVFGDSIIIADYDVKLQIGKGRSGRGIMIPDDAGSWRVPPEFAGTVNDNWLTRALRGNSTGYLSIIEQILKDELQRI